MAKKPSQSAKFKALAREAECDANESAFDAKLKRISKPLTTHRTKKAPAKKAGAKKPTASKKG